MSKRELNISNLPLLPTTEEDIILKSPLRIPPKELQNLKSLKGIKITDYAYYDITESENQQIHWRDSIIINKGNQIYGVAGYNKEEYNMKMGEFEDI